ncbi:MAG: TolC family protein [Deltaproteobacteria bacterium]|nr:TolC family protein [Deltaproteobacteria bacterium]
MRSALVLAILCVPAAATAEGPRLTLDQVMAKALASPKVQMADGDRAIASARIDEARAAIYPRIKATAFATLSPEINCVNPECTQTTPENFAWRFSGGFFGAQLDVTQPLYTFGKATHGRNAARAGLEAQKALVDEAAGDAAVDASRAYWGLKLARELGYMLDDGIDEIGNALKQIEEKGAADVSIQDRQRIAVLLAEAKVQRAEAKMGETQALAGLRALVGIQDADIDQDELKAITRDVPATASGDKRPQAIAARLGATAANELTEMARSGYYPDLALVGSAVISHAQGADNPPSVYANDPFNRRGVGLVLAMQWTLEPWNIRAKVNRARAEAHKAKAQSELAAMGANYDAQTALAEASASQAKVTAAAEGEKAARAWLASVLQAQAIGAAEAKDLADAYIAWFQMRARWAQAVYQWNVAVVRLGRASGEFRAAGNRP